jgi:hypothetical protein
MAIPLLFVALAAMLFATREAAADPQATQQDGLVSYFKT